VDQPQFDLAAESLCFLSLWKNSGASPTEGFAMSRCPLVLAVLCFVSISVEAAPITFSTFVSSSSIAAVEGQHSTIAFNYAGNKFVGSVYFGPNNNQLYSTDLAGGNVQKFSTPIPTAAGEVVMAAGLGKGGFTAGDIFAGSQNSGNIYHISNAGGSPTLFASGLTGGVRGILFDPGSSFGGNMLVATNAGRIYTVSSAGSVNLLANVGEDAEGMDIASSAWGPNAGSVLVGSEGTGTLRLISPGGAITVVGHVPGAETVSFVPLNLGSSGNPLEGFYVANYAVDVQFAGASQFAGLLGDAIVTSEDSSNARLWDVHYTGSGFTVTQLDGHLPNQSEDGIFVTAQRIGDIGGPSVPEPSTLMLVGGALAMTAVFRRKMGRP
jgi:hypothetical protein